MSKPKAPAKRAPAAAQKRTEPPAKAPQVHAAPVKKKTGPAPRPVVNKRTPRPVPAGRLPASPSTVPLQQIPALSEEAIAQIEAAGLAGPESTDGLPPEQVPDAYATDLLGAQVKTDLAASTYLRALESGGYISNAFNNIYHRGGATVHSGRAVSHVLQHNRGYRLP